MKSNLKLAALGLLAIGVSVGGQAGACSLAAWNAGLQTGAPTTDSPQNGVKRISGSCGMTAPVGSANFVTESVNHAAEGGTAPLRVRFFVYTGITAGTPTVFRALTGEGTGSSVVEVDYDAVDQNFDFRVNGAAAGSTTAGSAPRNKWISVRFAYQQGAAFSASTGFNGTATALTTSATGTGGVTVESVQLGVIASNGATGNLYFDEYESSRAASAGTGYNGPFTARCRGDANNTNAYELADIFGVVDEFLFLQGDNTKALATGQPDYDENGAVELADIFGTVDAFLAVQASAPGSGCP